MAGLGEASGWARALLLLLLRLRRGARAARADGRGNVRCGVVELLGKKG
jgi:hypothetical protein